jgi:hypothetical protein
MGKLTQSIQSTQSTVISQTPTNVVEEPIFKDDEKILPEFSFPDFDTIPVSTKTFIVITNLSFNIPVLVETLPITPYVVVPKKRGRKRKVAVIDPNKDIQNGSIITIEFEDCLRGVRLKTKKPKKTKRSTDKDEPFRNSMTVVMIVDGKPINFKITSNGKFQMTGCKKDSHAQQCIEYIWTYIKPFKNIYQCHSNYLQQKEIVNTKQSKNSKQDKKHKDKKVNTENQEKQNEGNQDNHELQERKDPFLKFLMVPAMRNIDINLGLVIDRKKLDRFFNTHTPYRSHFETMFGYTGVNIKMPVRKCITEMQVTQYVYDELKQSSHQIETVTYEKVLNLLTSKDRQKKLKKTLLNTFLVFHTGSVICSSLNADFAKDSYYEFIDIIRNNFEHFEEKLKKKISNGESQ